MANNTLNTRIILCNDTTLNWSTSEKVLLKGELGIELTDGVPKVSYFPPFSGNLRSHVTQEDQ